MFYAALDVSLRSVAICIIDHDGKICLERSVRSDVPDVLLCLAGFDQPIHQVGFEAGALTQPFRSRRVPSRGAQIGRIPAQIRGGTASQRSAIPRMRTPKGP